MQYRKQPYRSEGLGVEIIKEIKNAFKRPNNGMMQIIFINILIFLVFIILRVTLVLLGEESIYMTLFNQLILPASIPVFLTRPWTIITYFFMHEGFMHILFNMLFLYWFGLIIKEFLGGDKVVSLYILGGIGGGLLYLLSYNLIPYFEPRVNGSVMLGASGGVYAIVIGAATLLPNYVMHLLFIGPVRIKYIALFYVVMSFAQSAGENAGGELAHLGGALLGFLFIKQYQKGVDLGKPIHWTIRFIKSFFVSQPKVYVSYKRKEKEKEKPTSPKTLTSSQQEIDEILDKISMYGYESLTKEEKKKLFNAGNK